MMLEFKTFIEILQRKNIERAKVISCHHDAILVFNCQNTRSSDDRAGLAPTGSKIVHRVRASRWKFT
jgi:hypothetical protein